jgi:hypothetical protein
MLTNTGKCDLRVIAPAPTMPIDRGALIASVNSHDPKTGGTVG